MDPFPRFTIRRNTTRIMKGLVCCCEIVQSFFVLFCAIIFSYLLLQIVDSTFNQQKTQQIQSYVEVQKHLKKNLNSQLVKYFGLSIYLAALNSWCRQGKLLYEVAIKLKSFSLSKPASMDWQNVGWYISL